MSSVVSMIHDAVDSPEAWPDALKALTDAAEVAGAALIILNKSTGNVDEVCFSGLSAEFESDYLRYYAAVDPYSPLLDESWKTLVILRLCSAIVQPYALILFRSIVATLTSKGEFCKTPISV